MIKNNLKMMLITSAVILLPILVGVILWDKLPQNMPIHWNASGEVDGWCNKVFAVFGMPLCMMAIHWLCVVVTLSDPKKQNHSQKMMALVFWLVPALTIVVFTMTYAVAMGKSLQIDAVVSVFSGLLFVVIGNYMPKCKQNYTIGIKLPWTLHSEENWNRTHRFAGRIWVISGLAIILMGFFGLLWIMLGITLIMALVPIVYSYVLHLKGV